MVLYFILYTLYCLIHNFLIILNVQMNAALRTTFSSACKSFEFHPSLLFPVDECFKAAKQVEGLSFHACITVCVQDA